MEVEFKAWTKGSELALSFFDDRFRKRSRLAHRNDAPSPRRVADYGQQHDVAKSWTSQGRIDREDIALPGQAHPRTKSGRDRHALERSQRGAAAFVLTIAHGGGPTGRRPFRVPVCPVDCSILVCQRHRPDPDYCENVNRTKQDSRQADRSASASLFAPSAMTAASDGFWATASAFRRSQAVSIVVCRRLLNATRPRPGSITGRYSMTATPGRRRKPRRRQHSPVLTATGRQGTS